MGAGLLTTCPERRALWKPTLADAEGHIWPFGRKELAFNAASLRVMKGGRVPFRATLEFGPGTHT